MRPAAGHPVHLVIGLTLWFVWLTVVYAGSAVICATAPPPAEAGARNLWNMGLLALTLVFVLGFAAAAWRCASAARQWRQEDANGQRQRFFASSAAVLYAVAAISTVVVALPLGVLGPCV